MAALAAFKPDGPPALGAEITLGARKVVAEDGTVSYEGGEIRNVHCDCKEVRDRFESWLRSSQVLGVIEEMFRKKEISEAERTIQRQEAFREIRAGSYSYGSPNFVLSRTGTDAGVKQDLFIRLDLNHPGKIKQADVSDWVDEHKWQAASELMSLADGFPPKSNTSAANQPSAEV